ncbi:hypothetical protein [Ruegeria halocynthiae]|uniref:hypothetical protein n=1 Tax=Ruegeria halocynthiae TaxID=985054 RepID=UPI0005681F3E|nr:hypothetical protein [Ruegeria halocynthiae]
MIFGKRKLLLAVVAKSVIVTPAYTQAAEPENFDTVAFLQVCTDLVPNVPFAIPMDAECITQGTKMCDLATMNSELETCLGEVTEWMSEQIATNWSKLPEDLRQGREKPPTAKELANGTGIVVNAKKLDNCETAQIDGVSTEKACAYSDALAGWHALRVVQRSAMEYDQ